MAPIEIKLHSDWAIGKKKEDREITVDPDEEVNLDPSHDISLNVSCEKYDRGGRIELADRSLKLSLDKPSDSADEPSPVYPSLAFNLSPGESTAIQRTATGAILAEIKHVPAKPKIRK